MSRKPGTGSIYWRADGSRWVVAWSGNGSRRTKSFRDEAEARAFLLSMMPKAEDQGWHHGTSQAYQKYGCRCDVCQEARRAREAKRAKGLRVSDGFEHGTQKGYTYAQCRCTACTEYMRRRAAARAERTSQLRAAAIFEGRASHGTFLGVQSGCRCSACSSLRNRQGRREVRENDQSRESARNHGNYWTGPELELVHTRSDLSAKELAVMLGRTIKAVRCVKAAIAKDPRKAIPASAGGDGL